MTSNVRRSRGFSLLEIIVVLSIVALFVSSAASFIVSSGESDFDTFTVDFQNYVRETKLKASNADESVYIVFSHDKIWRSSKASLDVLFQSDIMDVPEGVRFSLKHKGDVEWRTTSSAKSQGVFWLFSRSGCCEPVELKLTSGDLEYVYEYDYLTAYPIENVDS